MIGYKGKPPLYSILQARQDKIYRSKEWPRNFKKIRNWEQSTGFWTEIINRISSKENTSNLFIEDL